MIDEFPEAIRSAITAELNSYEKVISVPTSATSFGNRGPWSNILYNGRWKDPALDAPLRAWAGKQVEYIRSEEIKYEGNDFTGTRGYTNYGMGDEKVRDVFGENCDRLSKLKAKYDPDNVFYKWFRSRRKHNGSASFLKEESNWKPL